MTAGEERATPIRRPDGRPLLIRTIRPSDGAELRRFHDGLSERTVYQRFFAPHPHLTDRDVDYFTHVDHSEREALVAVLPGDGSGAGDRIVGVGRFDVIGDEAAEVAFVVTDAHQGQGIATELLRQLIERARDRGLRALVAETLPGNAGMLRVFERCGLEMHTRHADGVVTVVLDLVAGGPVASSQAPR